MFPGMGNPAQMQKMMNQLGIKTTELPVERAVFYLKDGSALEMQMPQVVKMTIQGTETYQVVGKAMPLETNAETKLLEVTEDDIKMVMQQASCTKEQAEAALKESKGDIAEAIISLK